MRIHEVVLCTVVGVLGLITIILGVAGQASTAQSLVSNDGVTCEYRATPAVGCGIMAGLLALISQIVVTAASGCCGCCQTWGLPTGTKRIVAVVLAAISWLLVLISMVLFIVGAVANIGGDTQATYDGKCYVAPGSGLFAAATVLSLVAAGLQITSYVLLQATAPAAPAAAGRFAAWRSKPLAEEQQSGISMGLPVQTAERTAAAGGGGDDARRRPSAPPELPESIAEPTTKVYSE